MTFEMTGVVVDDEGAPVPGAKVEVWFDYVDLASVVTDESGHYTVNFVGVPGQNHLAPRDPVGTEEAVAFAQVDVSGYEPYARYILGSTPYLVEDVRLHRVTRIMAGQSAVVTIAPADTVCVLDVWPGRELICGTLRVVAPSNGTVRVYAVPIQAASQPPMLALYGGGAGAPPGNPTALQVAAGTEYTVRVEVPWGSFGSQSFVVNTTLQR